MRTFRVVFDTQNEVHINATEMKLSEYGVYEFFSGIRLVASFPVKGVLAVIDTSALSG